MTVFLSILSDPGSYLAILDTVTDGENPVVEVDAGAGLVVVHAGLVEVEGRLARVDGHGDGTDGGHRLLQGLLVVVGDVLANQR